MNEMARKIVISKEKVQSYYKVLKKIRELGNSTHFFGKDQHYFFIRKFSDESPERLWRKLNSYESFLNKVGKTFMRARVLDAGCGMGKECLFFSWLGAKEVIAVDYNKKFINGIKQYLGSIDQTLNIIPIARDLQKNLEELGKFDIVTVLFTISHLRHWGKFLKSISNMLDSSSVLIIIDDNSILNWKRRKELIKIWRMWELQGRKRFFNGKEIHEHSYQNQRIKILNNSNLPLSDIEIRDIASRTSRYTAQDVINAAQVYLAKGILPESCYENGTPPCDPISGMPKENPFNAYKLSKVIEKLGFSQVIHLPITLAPTNLLRRKVKKIMEVCKFFTYRLYRSSFVIVAKK